MAMKMEPPTIPWSEFATKQDLRELEARLEAKLVRELNEQTTSLFGTFVVTNMTTMLTVGGLAFAAARLA